MRFIIALVLLTTCANAQNASGCMGCVAGPNGSATYQAKHAELERHPPSNGCFDRYRTAHWRRWDCPLPAPRAQPTLREELEAVQPGWTCQDLGALVGIERLEWRRIVELENELKVLREDRDHAFQSFKDNGGDIHTRIDGKNVVCAGYPLTCVPQ